jgi:prolyl-tRNA synthetase
VIVTVGRGLADGVIELRDRKTGDRSEVPVAQAAELVLAAARG